MKLARLDKRSALVLAIFPTLALGLMNSFWLEWLLSHGATTFYGVDIFQWIVVPLLVWFFVLRQSSIKPHDYGLSFHSFKLLGQGLVAATLLWFTYRPTHQFAYRLLWPYASDYGYANIIPTVYPWNILAAFYFSTTAAFIEEIVFRGLPWLYFSSFLSPTRRDFWYLSLTPFLFAACHSEQGLHGVIATFVFGLVTAILYARFRNLWPLIFAHFVIDMAGFWPSAI